MSGKKISSILNWLGYISLAVFVVIAAVSAEDGNIARTVFHVGMINMMSMALLK